MRMLLLTLGVILLAGFCSEAGAFGSVGTAWRTYYDTACQPLVDLSNDCTLCHPGGNPSNLNFYSEDLLDYRDLNGGTWADAVDGIDGDDSDGDGVDNATEILVDCTEPGDPLSVPVESETWAGIKVLYR